MMINQTQKCLFGNAKRKSGKSRNIMPISGIESNAALMRIPGIFEKSFLPPKSSRFVMPCLDSQIPAGKATIHSTGMTGSWGRAVARKSVNAPGRRKKMDASST